MQQVAIIGAGPAGLMAAYRLVKNKVKGVLVVDYGNEPSKRKCPLEVTSVCTKCNPCKILTGVGGAGLISAGRLNLRPDIGGDLEALTGSNKKAWNLIKEVDNFFLKFGASRKVYGDRPEVKFLERKSAAAGIKFIPIRQRFIGSDNSVKVISNIYNYLREKGVKFLLKTKVLEIKKQNKQYLLETTDGKIKTKFLVIAPGRYGANWLSHQAEKLGLEKKFEPIDVGVRVEVPALVMDPVTEVSLDPKFHIYSRTYDDFTRTFCVNERGFVVKEVYDELILVNGHAMYEKKSENTNFAFLVRVKLTEPVENTTAFGRQIAKQANILGGGKPIIQKLGDLERGRRSTWKRIKSNHVKPTLTDVTPGDLALVLPHRILTDILEGLNMLDKVISGINSASTLLYAPEVKFSAHRIVTNKNLEAAENLFVAGDGAGVSRGIVTAGATGLIAAEGVIEKLGRG